MTDINVNPCEGGGNNTNERVTGSVVTDPPEPLPPEVPRDRVSFPERRITSPVPLSERNVTILNSGNFFDIFRIMTPPPAFGSEPHVRYADNTAANVVEVDQELIDELTELGETYTRADARQSFDPNAIPDGYTSAIGRGIEIARSKGLIPETLNISDIIAAASEYDPILNRTSLNERIGRLVPLISASGMDIDQIRYLSGLVFVDGNHRPYGFVMPSNNLQIANPDQFLQSEVQQPTARAYENLLFFGCPFVVTRPKSGQELLVTANSPDISDTNLKLLNLLGTSALKECEYILKFFPSTLQEIKDSVINKFKGEAFHDKVRNFARIMMDGETVYRTWIATIIEDIPFMHEARTLFKNKLISEGKLYTDITFEAPQAFFREEADLVALDRQFMVDINVNIGSAQLNDGSTEIYFQDTTNDELKKKNFYRTYSKQELTKENICREQQGTVVKFGSRNVGEFDQVNERQRNLFSKYVNIEIQNQKAQLTGISSILKQFDMDKYIIEMMSDTNGVHRLDELQIGAVERLPLLLDQYYDLDTTSTNIESYYSQYLQPGETVQNVRDRMSAVLENFNETSVRKGIYQQTWTSFGDNLNMVKLTLPIDHPLRNEILEDVQDIPGLYGSTNGIINALEWPLGFHEPLPDEIIGRTEEQNNVDPRPNESWRFDELKYAVCSAKLKEYLEPKGFRGMQDIYEGKKCFSEVIGYRIKKFEIVNGTVAASPIQEFYLMGHGSNNSIDFIDTQVIFEKKYKYEIFSINFVLGNLYQYTTPTGFDVNVNSTRVEIVGADNHTQIRLITRNTPAWFIVEAPLFARNIAIVDKPPLAPQVSFLPYMGRDDKMRLLLQSNYGNIKQTPISILPSDSVDIQNMYEAQQIDLANGKLEYANDSLPRQFQLIRISSVPTKYSDFASGKVITVNSNARTGIIEDDIEPNKDYYYIFRAKDDRGISNPGFVYKMRMVSYDNGIYMDLKEYDMLKKEDQITIPFREFFQIEPNNLNTSINFGDIDITDPDFRLTAPENVSLGNAEENAIWDRKFKIRIKSKSSARKIDFIVKFEKESPRIQTEEVADIAPPQDDVSSVCD